MALDLAWPRTDVYGDFPWIAFVFIGAVALVGLAWFLLRGRHNLGTLPEHMAKNLDLAENITEEAP
jgi:LPXTG-motif cell wall-anchored protein